MRQSSALLFALLALPASAAAQSTARAFLGVHVLPMDADTVLEDRVVLVEGERIAWIDRAGERELPPGVERIDADGAFLMPGLVDAHAHAAAEALPLYVAAGVTTVRIMAGSPERLAETERLEAEPSLPWPSLVVVGPLLAGGEVPWPHELVESAAAARRLVDEQRAAGYDALKIYDGLSAPVYDALVARAREVGMPFVGHVPVEVGLGRVLDAGQATLEHAEQLLYASFGRGEVMSLSPDRLEEVVAAFREADDPPCVTPTLRPMTVMMRRGTGYTDALYEALDWTIVDRSLEDWWRSYRPPAEPEAVARRAHFLELQSILTRELQDAGVILLAGTDTPYPLMVPGRSLVDELEALVDAGLTPFQALSAGTRNASLCLGVPDEFGVIAAGARADLVLVASDPRIEPETLRAPLGVMVRGTWFDREDLARLEQGVREAYEAR